VSASSRAAVVRIARRDILRSRWRSLLVVLLVMLPVAAMVGAMAVLQAITPTPDRSVTRQMGEAGLIVYPSGDEGTLARLQDALPAGSRIEPVAMHAGRLVLPGREASITLRSMDLDGLARGMLTVVEGRAPHDPREVAITAAVATLAGIGVGDPADVKGLASPTVVGIVEDPFDLRARIVLQDASAAEAAAVQQQATWLVALPPGVDATALGSNVAAPAVDPATFSMTSREQATNRSEAPTAAWAKVTVWLPQNLETMP